jgi:hypothetical protein
MLSWLQIYVIVIKLPAKPVRRETEGSALLTAKSAIKYHPESFAYTSHLSFL